MAASRWRRAQARDLVLVIAASVGVALVMPHREPTRGWLIADATTAVMLSGLVCLCVAVAFLLSADVTGTLRRERAMYVLLAVLTAAALVVGIGRVVGSAVGLPGGGAVLAQAAAVAIYLWLALRRRPAPTHRD